MLRISHVLCSLTLSCAVCLTQTAALAESSESETEPTAAQVALERALAYSGFSGVKYRQTSVASESAQLVLAQDTSLPFLGDAVNDKQVWEVEFHDLVMTDDGPCSDLKQCKIWIDPESGRFIQARLTPEESDGADSTLRNSAYYENVFRRMFMEYEGVPDAPPRTPLMDALRVPTLSQPCIASETVIWCVRLKYRDNDAPRTYWCIMGRGTPMLDLHGQYEGEDAPPLVNHLCLVDAETGQPATFLTVR